MKIAYVINSLSRPESCSDTVKAVRKFDVKHYVFLFVEKQELKIYRNVLNKLGTVKVRLIKLPETGKGVGYSRKFSLEYVNYLKYDYIITLDDDVLLLNNPIPSQNFIHCFQKYFCIFKRFLCRKEIIF